jgi:hypothetical protein
MSRFLVLAAALIFGMLPAYAQHGDAVHFFSNIEVAEDQEVHDVVCFFCSVNVDGTVTGDIVTFFGSSRIAGKAQKDVVSFLGSTDVEGSIGKDLVVFAGSVRLLPNSSVGHDMVLFVGSLSQDRTATIGHDSVHFPGIILLPVFMPFLLIALGIYLLIRWLNHRNDVVYPYPQPPR